MKIIKSPQEFYVRSVEQILERYTVKGMAHITGGGASGIYHESPRDLGAQLNVPSAEFPYIYTYSRDGQRSI